MEEVLRRTSLVPLALPCFVLCLIGLETEGLLDHQGRAGDHFHCTVEPSSGHIRCRFLDYTSPFFRELISVRTTPPITPKNFWGFKKRNSQKRVHLFMLPPSGGSPPPITPKYSQRINWRNEFHLCYIRKFSGN